MMYQKWTVLLFYKSIINLIFESYLFVSQHVLATLMECAVSHSNALKSKEIEKVDKNDEK